MDKSDRLNRLLPNQRGVWIPIDHGASVWGVEGATGLVPNGGALMLGGLSLGLIATYVEVQRKGKAEQMAQSYTSASEVHWD